MNDSHYTHSIAKNLIQAAQTLFASGPRELAQAVRSVALDDNELQAVSDREQSKRPRNRPK